MYYSCVDARFKFFNGMQTYTVEFSYGLNKWYVFEDDKGCDSLWSKTINPAKSKSPNRSEAESILEEYFETRPINQKTPIK